MANEKMRRERKLTAAEVCLIIKAGKDACARRISFSGLEIYYGVAAPSWPEHAPSLPSHPGVVASEDAEIDLIKRELAEKQTRLDEMPITDPVGYEELIAQDELRDGTDGAEETDTR